MSAAPVRRRLLLLADIFGGIHGGTEGQMHTLASNLPPGWEAELWVLQSSAYLDAHGFPCPHRSLGLGGFRSPRLPLDVRAIARDVRAGGFDLIHAFHADTCTLAPWIGRLADVPVITSRRDLGYWQGPHTIELLRRANRQVHAIVANSEAVRRRVIEVEHAHPARVHVIKNGHARARFEAEADPAATEALGIPASARVVGLLANVRPLKRQADLIDALAALGPAAADVHVLLIGTGPDDELAALRARAVERGVGDRVHVHGVTGDVVPWLRRLDIGVLASETEGLSNAIIEYMGCGLPVVATDVGGNPELVAHETSGLIVPPADVPALTAALDRLLADPELRAAYGAAGRARFEAELTVERMVAATLACYEAVIEHGTWTGARAIGGAPVTEPYAWSLVRTSDEVDRLRPAWTALLDDRAFFNGPLWNEAWWAWRGRRPYLLVARDVDGAVAGIVPWTELEPGVLGYAGQDEGADHLDLVARPGEGPRRRAGCPGAAATPAVASPRPQARARGGVAEDGPSRSAMRPAVRRAPRHGVPLRAGRGLVERLPRVAHAPQATA